jgi:GT2 family glycosyltransferase
MFPTLAFIVVSYNTRDLLDACLRSIVVQTKGVSYEIIVIDNASADGSAEMVREKYPQATLIQSGENLGFGRANNLGFASSKGRYILLLNSDAELLEDTGTALAHFLDQHPKAGVVGPDVVLRDGVRQEKTRGMLPTARVMVNQNLLLSVLFPRSQIFAGLYVESEWARDMRLGWVSGVCMAVRREAYAQVGGFDPAIFMYAEDVDLCRRLALLGWETWRINAHAVRHLCGGSTKSEQQALLNRVLQQRNFMRLLDRTMTPLGRAATRASYFVGLSMRTLLRSPAAVVGNAAQRLAFRADFHCLVDLLNTTLEPEESYAHRH